MVTNGKNNLEKARRHSAGSAKAKAYARSAITSGKRLFSKREDINTRNSEFRRWRDLYRDAMERSGGGHEQLCRSLASLSVERERIDAQAARGEPVNTWELVRLANAIDRISRRLGLIGADADNADASERKRLEREDREAGLA